MENSELSELLFNSLISNINEYCYIDIPFTNLPHSSNNYKNTLSFLHVNMRSLNKHENFDALYESLISIPFSPDVICILETRIRGDSLTNITTPNYNFVHADSITNAGGVAVYISSNYKFELDPELDMKVNGWEELRLNLKADVIPSKHITIGAIYRHLYNNSNYIENFTGALVNTISKINKRKGTFYLLGDFNIVITINKRTPSSLLFLAI